MSQINIEQHHALGHAEARKRVSTLEPKLKEKYGVSLEWNGNMANVKGTGVSGTLAVDDSKVAVDLKLGFLLRPMAGKIKEGLEAQVIKALA
ncbi:MAG: polyhydroxyalkanoic acid system family protein [Clostridia bacterium]|nr:polyhydroxyalkanoic acid system family protein [Deltaproteobacteria bacterium]